MKILRTPEVMALTRLSRVTIWRMEKAGQFPKRLQISRNSVGWLESEIHSWIADKHRGPLVEPPQLRAERMKRSAAHLG